MNKKILDRQYSIAHALTLSLKSKRDRAILATLLYHALRRDELCRLKVKDFKQERRGVPHLKVSGKGGKTRYVPLHPAAGGLIHEYLEAAGHELEENGAFCSARLVITVWKDHKKRLRRMRCIRWCRNILTSLALRSGRMPALEGTVGTFHSVKSDERNQYLGLSAQRYVGNHMILRIALKYLTNFRIHSPEITLVSIG